MQADEHLATWPALMMASLGFSTSEIQSAIGGGNGGGGNLGGGGGDGSSWGFGGGGGPPSLLLHDLRLLLLRLVLLALLDNSVVLRTLSRSLAAVSSAASLLGLRPVNLAGHSLPGLVFPDGARPMMAYLGGIKAIRLIASAEPLECHPVCAQSMNEAEDDGLSLPLPPRWELQPLNGFDGRQSSRCLAALAFCCAFSSPALAAPSSFPHLLEPSSSDTTGLSTPGSAYRGSSQWRARCLAAELAAARHQEATTQLQVSHLQLARLAAEKRCLALASELEVASRQREGLRLQVEQLHSALASTEESSSGLAAELAAVAAERELLLLRVAQLESEELPSAERRSAYAADELAQAAARQAELQHRVAQLAAALLASQEQVSSGASELSFALQSKEGLRQDVGRLQAAMAAAEEGMQASSSTLTSALRQRDELQGCVERLTAEQAEQALLDQARHREMQQRVLGLGLELEAAGRSVASVRLERDSLREMLEAAQGRMAMEQEAMASLQGSSALQLSCFQDAIAALELQLASAKQHSVSVTETITGVHLFVTHALLICLFEHVFLICYPVCP